jgi:cytochrome P450
VVIGGVEIPAGEFIFVSLTAANRDNSRFPGADKLDVTRKAAGHIAFGHGIHHCVGAPLARLEGQLAIGSLLARFPGMKLATGEDLVWRDSTLMRGLERLPVKLG